MRVSVVVLLILVGLCYAVLKVTQLLFADHRKGDIKEEIIHDKLVMR
jgi:hypothetical protein